MDLAPTKNAREDMNLFLFDVSMQECWDKDIFSDDFMGSMQFTDRDLHIFQVLSVCCVCMYVHTCLSVCMYV